ncbi:Putative peptidoglycan binding domain-containing protein [Thermomonospora echinospora]|uniref:Putative peptidoglycan binding domain-containing protein n=1 Tax=Thermomonospora echinospora TaxID=1992 RepID=A0A1H5XD95_9ACTN|nr:peptidoglycan-binding protein [Thermomonospora echinospora]SEG09297.1 Putative peptidoglycan binding domain-containing protein [Thermomonospora echinospora]
MRVRSALRYALVIVVTAVLPLGLAVRPAQAQAPDFTTMAGRAVAKVMPGHALREQAARRLGSPLHKSQRVRLNTATFTGHGRVFVVARTVGAMREVTRAQAAPGTRVTAQPALRRPGAGTRRALVTSSADEWGPGLTTLSWSERPGVNYRIAVRGPVTQRDLVRLAQALPKDGTKVSKKVRSLVAGARPPVDPGVDGSGGVGVQGTGNKIVDGAGVASNDLSDEATLCNGCGYWSGNYAGMFQYLLYADGKMAYSSIDCQFGGQTASAAANWQAANGLAADGIAGPDTRGRMDNYLAEYGDGYVDYLGTSRILSFRRISDLYYYGGTQITYGYGGGRLPAC